MLRANRPREEQRDNKPRLANATAEAKRITGVLYIVMTSSLENRCLIFSWASLTSKADGFSWQGLPRRASKARFLQPEGWRLEDHEVQRLNLHSDHIWGRKTCSDSFPPSENMYTSKPVITPSKPSKGRTYAPTLLG